MAVVGIPLTRAVGHPSLALSPKLFVFGITRKGVLLNGGQYGAQYNVLKLYNSTQDINTLVMILLMKEN